MSDSPVSCCWSARILGRLAALALLSVAARAGIDPQVQQAMIRETVAAFPEAAAHEDGRVFFLGFAGHGGERVFAEEVKLAAQHIARRHGSGRRSLLLVNDRRDLTTLPFATHENLRFALHQLARVMDAERDVLFLVLSSHGSEDGLLSVSNTGFQPDVGISASTVALFLRESGIRWKVVVVSACFSGQFVEPLAASRTIVITAASKSRPSFGCSDERHLTYFGEAFFRDALPAARSLRSAFESARRAIRARERAEGFRASQPQAYFGPLMEARLEELPAEVEGSRRLPDWAE
jgi:hypothetical protein